MQVKVPKSLLAKHVQASIRQRRLVAPRERLLVGVSGGPDSLALLHVLCELAPAWEWRLSVVHVNHGLRGLESEEDAAFVANLCREMEIPFFCEPVGVARRASRVERSERKPNSSLQARAREARYAVFRRVAEGWGADKIALGHTADDQAETLLLWMLRGAGTTGLAGIPQMRDDRWVRPLLEVSRADVMGYLTQKGLRWRMDSSNTKPVYARNRVRLQLLPVLKELNPAVLKVLARQTRILREEDRCLEELATEQLLRLVQEDRGGTCSLGRKDLTDLPLALQRRVLRALIRKVTGGVQSPAFGTVEAIRHQIIDGHSGSMLNIAGGLVWRVYDRIGFSPRPGAREGRGACKAAPIETEIALVEGSMTIIPWALSGQTIRLSLQECRPGDASTKTSVRPDRTVLDAGQIAMPLAVRSWRPGDWFRPAGMAGHRKKLQDYFADIKMPRDERYRVPLLVARDQIIWVAGHRADHRALATMTSTRLLIAEVEEAPEKGRPN